MGQAARLRRAGSGRLCCAREVARSGKIKPSLNGIPVSGEFIPALEAQYLRHTIPGWFRLFVGDLSNDVSDDVLTSAFNKYPSFMKARVIRDRLSQKVEDYPFPRHACTDMFSRRNSDLLHSPTQRTS